MIGDDDGSDAVEVMPMVHLRIRQPSVAGSWVPIVCLQCLHMTESVCVASSTGDSYIKSAHVA